jgi:hypothetical protein
MTDYIDLKTPNQDVQLHTGKGHIAGVIVTSTSTTPDSCTLYDYAGAGPPTGPKIFEVMNNCNAPNTLLFNDRYAPRFHDGVWLHLGANCYATFWIHIPKP